MRRRARSTPEEAKIAEEVAWPVTQPGGGRSSLLNMQIFILQTNHHILHYNLLFTPTVICSCSFQCSTNFSCKEGHFFLFCILFSEYSWRAWPFIWYYLKFSSFNVSCFQHNMKSWFWFWFVYYSVSDIYTSVIRIFCFVYIKYFCHKIYKIIHDCIVEVKPRDVTCQSRHMSCLIWEFHSSEVYHVM